MFKNNASLDYHVLVGTVLVTHSFLFLFFFTKGSFHLRFELTTGWLRYCIKQTIVYKTKILSDNSLFINWVNIEWKITSLSLPILAEGEVLTYTFCETCYNNSLIVELYRTVLMTIQVYTNLWSLLQQLQFFIFLVNITTASLAMF